MPENEPVKIDPGWDHLALAREGDQEAWKALYRQHSQPLLRMATLLTGSADAARDCVQETFVRALTLVVHHRTGSLRGYLSTITYRLALKENARRQRLASPAGGEPVSHDPSPLEEAIAGERQRETVRIIRALPAHHREVLILRLHGGHSYEEIAKIMGLPLGTVKSRIFHAVKSARSELKRRGMT